MSLLVSRIGIAIDSVRSFVSVSVNSLMLRIKLRLYRFFTCTQSYDSDLGADILTTISRHFISLTSPGI